MKGTLLVLALLMTILAGEACSFYKIFSSLMSGNKEILDLTLDEFGATNGEKEFFGEMQDCYNEEPMTLNKDCQLYYSPDMIKKFLRVIRYCLSQQ